MNFASENDGAPHSHNTRAALKILSSVHHLLVSICHCVPGERVIKGGPFSTSLTPHLHSNELFASPAGIQILFLLPSQGEGSRERKHNAPSAGQIYIPARGCQNSAPLRTSLSSRECLNKRPGSPFDNRRVIYGRAEKCNSPLECAPLSRQFSGALRRRRLTTQRPF